MLNWCFIFSDQSVSQCVGCIFTGYSHQSIYTSGLVSSCFLHQKEMRTWPRDQRRSKVLVLNWCFIFSDQSVSYRDALDAYSQAIHINPYTPEVWLLLHHKERDQRCSKVAVADVG